MLTDSGIDITKTVLTVEDYVAEAHINKVAETNDLVVLQDTVGHELNVWAKDLNMPQRHLSEMMHNLARENYGREDTPSGGDPWSVYDPLVLKK